MGIDGEGARQHESDELSFPFAGIAPGEPVVAYKLARVFLTAVGQFRFCGIGVGVGYDNDAVASCATSLHRAPNPGCNCGFWGVYRVGDLRACTSKAYKPFVYDHFVRLTVELSGAGELHELGLRAARQRVLCIEFPSGCGTKGCSEPSVGVIVAQSTGEAGARPLQTVCERHGEGGKVLTKADLAGELGTEVTFGRVMADEGSGVSEPTGKVGGGGATPGGVWLSAAELAARRQQTRLFMAGIALMTLCFVLPWVLNSGGLVPTGEDLSGLVTHAEAHPRAIFSYDSEPIIATPIYGTMGKGVAVAIGAAVFDLASNRCSVVVESGVPQRYLETLGAGISSYSTAYATAADQSSSNQEFAVLRGQHLGDVLSQRSPYVVAEIGNSTAGACKEWAAKVSAGKG